MGSSDRGFDARRMLRYGIMAILLVISLPLIFDTRARKLFGLALLGILYSTFLVNVWERSISRMRSWPVVGWFLKGPFQTVMDWLLPFRAWGVVPCIIEIVVFLFLGVFTWFLGPLFYEIVRNPSTMGWLREFFQENAPEVFRILNEISFSPEPYQVLRENARQVFSSLNRFFSAIVLPLTFFTFTAIGAALYDSLRGLLQRAESRSGKRSRILDHYAQLFGQYLRYNTIYYLILGGIISGILVSLDRVHITDFGWNVITGLYVSFIGGNLLIPGMGTLILSVLVCAQVFIWQGWFGLIVAGGAFVVYFAMDDYVVKPVFLHWMGKRPGRDWDFGVEILVLAFLILYATFGLIGTLLTFPGLCFLDAYLRHQFPDLRPWVLHPIRTMSVEPEESSGSG